MERQRKRRLRRERCGGGDLDAPAGARDVGGAGGAKDGPLAEALLARTGLPLHLAGHLRLEEWNGSIGVGFVVHDAAAV